MCCRVQSPQQEEQQQQQDQATKTSTPAAADKTASTPTDDEPAAAPPGGGRSSSDRRPRRGAVSAEVYSEDDATNYVKTVSMHPTPTHHTYIERELDTQAAIIAEQMNIKNSIITTDTIKYVTYKTIKLIKVTLVYEVA